MEEEASGGVGDVSGAGGVRPYFEAAAGVVEIEQDTAAGFDDHAHGLVEDFAALAVGGEYVAGGATGVVGALDELQPARIATRTIAGQIE